MIEQVIEAAKYIQKYPAKRHGLWTAYDTTEYQQFCGGNSHIPLPQFAMWVSGNQYNADFVALEAEHTITLKRKTSFADAMSCQEDRDSVNDEMVKVFDITALTC